MRGSIRRGVRTPVRTAQASRPIEGSDLLVAAGAFPTRPGSGWTTAGVELDATGYIESTIGWRPPRPCLGDGECAGSPQFTHVSVDDFRIIRDNLAGGNRSTRGRLVPFCMFTDPPLARVGLSEREAGTARHRGARRKLPMRPCCGRGRPARRGLHEGLVGARRPHSRLYDDWPRSGRGHGGGAGGDAGGLPYTRSATRSHAPDDGGGLGPLFSNVPPISAG